MKTLLWILVGLGALAWSLLAWLLYAIAGSGGAAVVSLTRWLEIDPASTQWIADTLSLAGGIAQWLVVLMWLLGMAVLGVVGWLGGQAAGAATAASRDAMRRAGAGVGPVIDGQVSEKSVAPETGSVDKTSI